MPIFKINHSFLKIILHFFVMIYKRIIGKKSFLVHFFLHYWKINCSNFPPNIIKSNLYQNLRDIAYFKAREKGVWASTSSSWLRSNTQDFCLSSNKTRNWQCLLLLLLALDFFIPYFHTIFSHFYRTFLSITLYFCKYVVVLVWYCNSNVDVTLLKQLVLSAVTNNVSFYRLWIILIFRENHLDISLKR